MQGKRDWTSRLERAEQGAKLLSNGSVRRFGIPEEGRLLTTDAIVLAARGTVLWGEHEGYTGLHILHHLVPHARCMVVPVLGVDGSEFGPYADPPFVGSVGDRGYYKLDALTLPDDSTVVLSRSALMSPAHLAYHEAWHEAEHNLLSDDEVRAVGHAHARASLFLDIRGIRVEPDPREWAAHAFARWAELHNYSAGAFTAPAGLHDLFYGLLTGEVGKRKPRRTERKVHLARLRAAHDEWISGFAERRELDGVPCA